jgi:hypothetical protein
LQQEKLLSLGFDIFRRMEDGSVIWVGEAETLQLARQKLEASNAAKPGTYFVRDAATGEVVNHLDLDNFGKDNV